MSRLTVAHIGKIREYLEKNKIPPVKCPKCGLEYYVGRLAGVEPEDTLTIKFFPRRANVEKRWILGLGCW